MPEEVQAQKNDIIRELKSRGLRMTRQRMLLLDIILQEEFSSCKELILRISQVDSTIGAATVYRMVNTLEDIGAIRKSFISVGGQLSR